MRILENRIFFLETRSQTALCAHVGYVLTSVRLFSGLDGGENEGQGETGSIGFILCFLHFLTHVECENMIQYQTENFTQRRRNA